MRHSFRILMLIDNQVRSLRKRQVIGSYISKLRQGAYWGIGSDLAAGYKVPGALPCPFEKTEILAKIDTRLKKLDQATQEKLINWGYAVSDAGLRQYLDTTLPPPANFPFGNVGVG